MKLLRAYAITAIICLSLTSIISCIFIADENARKISLDDKSAVVVMSSTDEKLFENAVNFSEYFNKIKSVTEKAAGIAPPPVNNIYWFFNAGNQLYQTHK